MPMVRAMRMLNAIEAGTLSGSQLETLLTADPGRLAELNQLLTMRGQCRRLAASNTAMTAVAASTTAMTAVIASNTAMTAAAASNTAMTAVAASATAMAAVAASATATDAIRTNAAANNTVLGAATSVGAYLDRIRIIGGAASDATLAALATMTAVAASATAMAAVAASATAMAAVAASNTASDAVFTSAAARLAIYNSDTALAAYQANPAQVQRQIDTGGRTVTGSTATVPHTYVANGTRVILLRVWTTGGSEDLSLRWGRGLTTDDAAGGVRLPNGDNLGVATAALGRTATYANSGTYPSANNANANVVSAANGLRRGTWSLVGNTTQNVIYITV